MLDMADEQPTASLSAIIAAEALRAIILAAAEGDVSKDAVQLMREIFAVGQQFRIGLHAESLSDIVLKWPLMQGFNDDCKLPMSISLNEQELSDQRKQILNIHHGLKDLEYGVKFGSTRHAGH